MSIILGLDPSIRKSGYCVVDTEAPYGTFVEKGRLYTKVEDGILIQRLIKQSKQISDLMDRYSIGFVSMEAPFFGEGESEHLFALNQFIHRIFLEKGTFVISFPPQQMKSLAIPDKDPNDIGKNHMILAAQVLYHLMGSRLTDDEADAMHAAHLGKIYYQWQFDKTLKKENLSDFNSKIPKAFHGKHTFTRGVKKGTTEYKGLIYRENDLFWDFKKVAERQEKRKKLLEDKKNGRKKNSN